MSRLTIAIPTFRRPQDLKRAVRGVLEQAGELVGGLSAEAREPEGDPAGAADGDGGAKRGVSDVEVLVIDNDAQGTGREAARSRGERRGVTVSIGWPYLLGGGMRIDDETASRMREGWGLEPLDVTTMCRALEAAVASGRSHVLPLAGDRDRIQRTFDLVPVTMPPMALPVAPAEKNDKLRRATETWLVSVVAETLHADPAKVLAAESFASLGVDSILMLQLVRAFEKELGQLPKTLFFEFEDLDALTRYFVAEHGAAGSARRC